MEVVAVSMEQFPTLLLDELHGRIHARAGQHEVRCWWLASPAWLPIEHAGQVRAPRWGCKRGASAVLPMAKMLNLESVEKGRLNELQPVEVLILADWVRAGGAWWRVGREWFRGRGGETNPAPGLRGVL